VRFLEKKFHYIRSDVSRMRDDRIGWDGAKNGIIYSKFCLLSNGTIETF